MFAYCKIVYINKNDWKTTFEFQINFEMVLTGEMDFSRCKRFSIRGYDQVRLHSIVSTEIKDCKAFNPVLINPNIVIDAVGAASATGQFIFITLIVKNILAYLKSVHFDTLFH